ncbi:hypothetical protein SDC9_42378 [bioreactor metagenome]|uniref:Uncharacterized protein n=1 Tax=bioreactor metagenome TaxID=1076179 RepID=A0A644W0W3_9ZZZZ
MAAEIADLDAGHGRAVHRLHGSIAMLKGPYAPIGVDSDFNQLGAVDDSPNPRKRLVKIAAVAHVVHA